MTGGLHPRHHLILSRREMVEQALPLVLPEKWTLRTARD
jgi:hypothetical protein